MNNMEMWVHQDTSILMQGRTKHADPPAQEDVEPEELLKREVAKDPW